ncbi:hypothetical protein Hypma_000294 [Hypsizygus marmoreus]|uniref:Phosphatidylglycerol/phosphatidylinositol transfer protein n=1 Tax=Hypsizygus marmoreus TaxID=39966 RepID=A0A369J8M9_HYPMA|nr:hypothetical protein Hypma_000294 [Hypsizygus marmoreus]
MKFIPTIIAILSLLGATNAQRSFIGNPQDGATVTGGRRTVVQVVRPDSLQGSTEVGIVIGLQSCPITNPFPCAPPNEQVGTILYKGKYKPKLHEQPGRPYQNFTVTIPDADYFVGRAQLSVVRFHLIGAGPSPVLELNNITLNVV